MGYAGIFSILFVIVAIAAGLLYLLYKLAVNEKSIHLLVSLFAFAAGLILLFLDVILIVFSLGPEFVSDYILFKKSAGDYGIAGRWIFTSYVFCSIGVGILVYYFIFARKTKRDVS